MSLIHRLTPSVTGYYSMQIWTRHSWRFDCWNAPLGKYLASNVLHIRVRCTSNCRSIIPLIELFVHPSTGSLSIAIRVETTPEGVPSRERAFNEPRSDILERFVHVSSISIFLFPSEKLSCWFKLAGPGWFYRGRLSDVPKSTGVPRLFSEVLRAIWRDLKENASLVDITSPPTSIR